MTAYDNVGGLKPRRNSGNMQWGLGGLIIGILIGLAMPRIWNRLRGTPSTQATTAVKPRPNPIQMLQITARPEQRGLLVSAPVPLKMLKTSETKRAKQQDRAVFTGFKNWGGTTNYLVNGQGDLLIKASDGSTTKWTREEYKALLQNKPLTAKIKAGQSYTLLFQRQGRRTVDLGTFSIAGSTVPAPVAAVEAEEETAPLKEKNMPTTEDKLGETIEPDAGGDADEPREVHDTSELDSTEAPVEDAPSGEKVID